MSRRRYRLGEPVGPSGVLACAAKSGPRWHEARAGGIGGSDAPAVLGLSPWRSAWEVWAEKTGRLVAAGDPPSEAAYFGHALEPVVAQEWQHREGAGRWRLVACPGVVAHRDEPWRRCTVDRLVAEATGGEPDPVALLECKTSGRRADWPPGEPATGALVQVQHSLAVLGYDRAFVAVLLGGQEFRAFEVARDEDFIALMLDRERAFWRSVTEDREPPAVDARDEPALRRLYRDSVAGAVVELPAEALADVAAYAEAQTVEREARTRKAGAAARLMAALADAENGLHPQTGRLLCSWRGQTRESIDIDALRADLPEVAAKFTRQTTSRTFRLH